MERQYVEAEAQKKKAVHVVTAFASELQLVLGQLATDEKSNEITAIPRLLENASLYLKTEVLTQPKNKLREKGHYEKTIEKGHGRIEI